ncbi:MAG: hypothetical protein IPM97_16360 [Bdellovibrionaceae bacterium]|nr:hypothetical protein [Pseudobdellovibrionaceae bacterium]OYZ18357.1 MAG: hypothetical protein B7Y39_13625 [Bdellovibrio sp. 28-41-41]
MMPNLEVLGSLVRDLYQGLSQLFYVMLPLTILFSIVFGYLKSGDANYPDLLKRAFVAALLLASFPEVSNLILDICDGIALKIDDMSGLEAFMKIAQEKSLGYSAAKNVLMLKFDGLFMAVLSFGSFALLYIAKYLTIILYYFYWALLSICAPLMILCYIFPSTARITVNLYKGLIEVACWKIIWAILSAMLKSVSFGFIYENEQAYLPLVAMNFIIAIALLYTPKVLQSLTGEGINSTARSIGSTAASAATMMLIPVTKLAMGQTLAQSLLPKSLSHLARRPKSNTTHNSNRPRRS